MQREQKNLKLAELQMKSAKKEFWMSVEGQDFCSLSAVFFLSSPYKAVSLLFNLPVLMNAPSSFHKPFIQAKVQLNYANPKYNYTTAGYFRS